MLRLTKQRKAAIAVVLIFSLLFFIGPSLVRFVESLAPEYFLGRYGGIHPYIYYFHEASLRIYFLAGLTLIASFVLFTFDLPKLRLEQKIFLYAFLSAFFIAALILLFDKEFFYAESSKLGIVTAGAFLVAGILGLANLIAQKRHKILWGILALFPLIAALDEIFALHEKIAELLGGSTTQGGGFNDLITITGIFSITLIIYWFLNSQKRAGHLENIPALKTMFIGGIILIASTFFDTFDFILAIATKRTVESLYASLRFTVIENLFIFYNMHVLFNSVEELLELFGAVMFAIAFVFTLLALKKLSKDYNNKKIWEVELSKKRLNSFIAVMLFANFLALFTINPGVILEKDYSADTILGPENGLMHVDDLFMSKELGLIVANEGKGNVLVLKEQQIRTLEFEILKNVDSVTAFDESIYISDPLQKTVYKVQDGEISIFSSGEEHGFVHPGGIAVDRNGALILLDEKLGEVLRIMDNKIEKIATREQGIVSPEGIVIGKDDEIYVTDDLQGAIFKIGKTVEKIASRADGLINPEDITIGSLGNIYVTDNGARAVFKISNGKLTKIVSFTNNYGDLQGIAIDKEGNLIVAVSDMEVDYCIMPSLLIKISARDGEKFE